MDPLDECLTRLHRDGSCRMTGAAVDALVDVVHGHAGRLHAGRERVLDGAGARETPAAATDARSRCGRESGRGTTPSAAACSRRARRGRRRGARASPPSRGPAYRGREAPRARRHASGMPASSARSSARMPRLLLATDAIGKPASMSACRFDPSPETSTPIMSRSPIDDRVCAAAPERRRTYRSRD